MMLGLQKAAKYYYYPGWHEPGTVSEATFNKKAYDSLPKELQELLDYTTQTLNVRCLLGFEASNSEALRILLTKYKVKLMAFPPSVMKGLRKLADEVLEEEASKDAMSRKVHDNFKKFRDEIGPWGMISEKAYYNEIMRDYALKGLGGRRLCAAMSAGNHRNRVKGSMPAPWQRRWEMKRFFVALTACMIVTCLAAAMPCQAADDAALRADGRQDDRGLQAAQALAMPGH